MEQTKTLTLVEFLTARLDEDEAAARAATEGPWYLDAPDRAYVGNRGDGRPHGLWEIVHMSGDVLDDLIDEAQRRTLADAAHIARHDPARVLREVEAKRRIVALHAQDIDEDAEGRLYSSGCVEDESPFPCPTLRALAGVYADHPDYRDEWRP